MRMKNILAIAILGMVLPATAAELVVDDSAPSRVEVKSNELSVTTAPEVHDWSVEAQFNTISNSVSPTFGSSALYFLDANNQVGVRVLAPLSFGEGTTSAMGVYRHIFSENKTTLLAEFTLAQNVYSFGRSYGVSSGSMGTNIGILHHLNEDIAFGGIAGTEWTNVYLTKHSADNNGTTYIYGRLGLFASLGF